MRSALFATLVALAVPAMVLTGCETAETDAVAVTAPDGAEVSVQTSSADVVAIGERVDDGAAFVTPAALVDQAETLDGQTVSVEGTVRTVCRNSGCWLTMDAPDGQTVRVVVPKDEAGEYVYTFPTDITGASVRLVGTFAVEEESVEMQRHLAEDEGAPADAVAKITEPSRSLVLTAQGAEITRA